MNMYEIRLWLGKLHIVITCCISGKQNYTESVGFHSPYRWYRPIAFQLFWNLQWPLESLVQAGTVRIQVKNWPKTKYTNTFSCRIHGIPHLNYQVLLHAYQTCLYHLVRGFKESCQKQIAICQSNRVGYCIPVPDFYQVVHGFRCRKSTLMD